MSEETKTTKRNKPETVRGTGTFNRETNEFEFHPYQEGVPAKRAIKKTSQSELYETTGERKPLIVAHLKCPKDTVDPEAVLREEFERLTAGIRKQPVKAAAKNRKCIRYLRDTDALKVWRELDRHRLVAQLVLDTTDPRISTQMFNLAYELNKIITSTKINDIIDRV